MNLSQEWSWQDLAACHGHSLALFFGTEKEQYDRPAKERREAKAKAVCASCPVAEDCREYALSRREYGIWGGMTDEERASERRRRTRRAAAAGKREAA